MPVYILPILGRILVLKYCNYYYWHSCIFRARIVRKYWDFIDTISVLIEFHRNVKPVSIPYYISLEVFPINGTAYGEPGSNCSSTKLWGVIHYRRVFWAFNIHLKPLLPMSANTSAILRHILTNTDLLLELYECNHYLLHIVEPPCSGNMRGTSSPNLLVEFGDVFCHWSIHCGLGKIHTLVTQHTVMKLKFCNPY